MGPWSTHSNACARRDAAVKEKEERGLPKAVWLGLLLILAMLFLLLWTT